MLFVAGESLLTEDGIHVELTAQDRHQLSPQQRQSKGVDASEPPVVSPSVRRSPALHKSLQLDSPIVATPRSPQLRHSHQRTDSMSGRITVGIGKQVRRACIS